MSSRLTATQIVAQGDYLDPTFDPTTLTVSQLLGVLGYHNIQYPTPYSKAKLVNLFNEEIKTRSSKLKKERLQKANSIGSDEGIIDGLTGEPLNKGRREAPARRSSRRLSRPPEDLEPAPRHDPPKRRRSSAQPDLGGPSRKSMARAVEPALVEEEEDDEEVPTRKAVRTSRDTDASDFSTRRKSHADDSGWDDNNIFQSGAESSSPLRPSPKSKSRRLTTHRKSRKSMSAPPQLSPPSSPQRASYFEQKSALSPPTSKFAPDLPPEVRRRSIPPPAIFATPSPAKSGFLADSSVDELNIISDTSNVEIEVPHVLERIEDDTSAEQEAEDEELSDEGGELDADEAQVLDIQKRLSGEIVPSRFEQESQPSIILRIFYFLLLAAASASIYAYKQESSPIGYCDANSDTNRALEAMRARRFMVEECNRENRTLLYPTTKTGPVDLEPCPVLPILPFTIPDSCTPCPDHATCTQHSVTCEKGYLLRPHPLFFFLPYPPTLPNGTMIGPPSSLPIVLWKSISALADGLPGLGSVAFPPRCLEDPRRKRHIGILGRAIEAQLGVERGRRYCNGEYSNAHFEEKDGGEARKWGFEMNQLRELVTAKSTALDDVFIEAIQQLIQWGGVIMSEDSSGKRYIAHSTPTLTWTCALTVKFRETWAIWRSTVFTVVGFIAFVGYIRARISQRFHENQKVAALVSSSLEAIRNQAYEYNRDPSLATQPYVPSLQLRDMVLQGEHDVGKRKRIWTKVAKVVEGNTNVRVNQEEVLGGDEMRVWQWVGTPSRNR